MIRMDAKIGTGTKIWQPELVNLYGCTIGEDCNIGAFVEIGPGVIIGDRVRVANGCFIPEGVVVESDVFLGPHVIFTNDPYPPSNREAWKPILVKKGASIGAGSIILPGVTIGEGALVGAGSVISRNVLPGAKVYGEAAKDRGWGEMLRRDAAVEKGYDEVKCAQCGRAMRYCICEKLSRIEDRALRGNVEDPAEPKRGRHDIRSPR